MTDTTDKLTLAINEKINPMLEMHRGGCELRSFDNGIASIKLVGGCAGCPSALQTLYQLVYPILTSIDGVNDVVLEAE